MIELSRHIESLMLKHDCVIVPGLGGFVTQYVPARRIADEQLFLPPYRSVGFNQQLTLNDGLLVQSYMQAYDTNYPETIKLINEAVHQLKEELQEKGEYNLSGIGRLTLGMGGLYNFTPCEAGVLSPELYGLDSLTLFEKQPVGKKNRSKNESERSTKKKIQFKRTEKNYTFSVNRELFNYVAAVVVAVFFYFLWATPVTPSKPADIQAASIINDQLFAKPDKATVVEGQSLQAPVPVEVQPTTNEKQPEQPQANVKAEKAIQQTALNQTQNPPGKFTLVLVSAITENNAKLFCEQMKQKNFQEASVYKRGDMVRVVYGQYANEDEAMEALKKLRKNEDFKEAWILEKK